MESHKEQSGNNTPLESIYDVALVFLHAHILNELLKIRRRQGLGETVRKHVLSADIVDPDLPIHRNLSDVMPRHIYVLRSAVKLRVRRESNGALVICIGKNGIFLFPQS